VKRRCGWRARQHDAVTSELVQQRAYQAAIAELQGQRAAVQLYRWLAAGRLPPALPTVSPDGTTIHLDVILRCASWHGHEVQCRQVSTFAVGPPVLIVTSLLGTTVANKRLRQRAKSVGQPQWQDHGFLRFLVTSTATWCRCGNDWRHFAHSAVTGYQISSQACSIGLADAPSLRLSGPGVWSHAVLFGYWRCGADGLQQAPFLEQVRQTASQRPTAVPV
jgi:hypothetical protein